MIVFADVDIAELASNAFGLGALSVRLGELYPDPPLVIDIEATLAPVPRLARKLIDPLTGVKFVDISGVNWYNPLPSLVTLITPIEPLVDRVAVAVATESGFDSKGA